MARTKKEKLFCEIKYCKCECKRMFELTTRRKYFNVEYINGHNNKGKHFSEEHKQKISESNILPHMGKTSPMKGKNYGEEFKEKCRQRQLGKPSCMKGKKHKSTSIEKLRNSLRGRQAWNKGVYGERNSMWKGGISKLPYCEKWTFKLREEVRNIYKRKCFLCDLDEDNNITKNGKRQLLSVHHIDGDKEQGCNGKKWFLVPLCRKCHGKVTGKNKGEYYKKLIGLLVDIYIIKDVWNWFR